MVNCTRIVMPLAVGFVVIATAVGQDADRLAKSKEAQERSKKFTSSVNPVHRANLASARVVLTVIIDMYADNAMMSEQFLKRMAATNLRPPITQYRIADIVLDHRHESPEIMRFARHLATEVMGDYIRPKQDFTMREAWDDFVKKIKPKLPKGEPMNARRWQFLVKPNNFTEEVSAKTAIEAGNNLRAKYRGQRLFQCLGEAP